MKKCNICKKIKNNNEFYKNNKSKDNLQSKCKSCTKKYCKENVTIINDRMKQYRIDNKEKTKAYRKHYNENNKEKINVYNREYRKNNLEKTKKYDKVRRKNKLTCVYVDSTYEACEDLENEYNENNEYNECGEYEGE